MRSTKLRGLGKAVRYLCGVIPGAAVIGGLVYLYVVRQWSLVAHPHLYWLLVVFTVSLSLLFSLLESALMTINIEQARTQLEAKARQLSSQHDPEGEVPSDEYRKARHDLFSEMELVSEAGEYNAPIVVLNHLSTVVLGAFLPYSFSKDPPHAISVDVCSSVKWLGLDPCPIDIWGAGAESLTFFTVSLLLIVFGKIVPEKIGRRHNVWIISKFRGVIEGISSSVGLLVKPMLAIGDFFLFLLKILSRR
jgi:CBS domain containing-hemolysin-like protein